MERYDLTVHVWKRFSFTATSDELMYFNFSAIYVSKSAFSRSRKAYFTAIYFDMFLKRIITFFIVSKNLCIFFLIFLHMNDFYT